MPTEIPRNIVHPEIHAQMSLGYSTFKATRTSGSSKMAMCETAWIMVSKTIETEYEINLITDVVSKFKIPKKLITN